MSPPPAAPWPREAAAVSIAQVADALGNPVGRGRVLGACPACGDGGEGSPKVFRGKDGRDRLHCYRCDVTADVVDFVALSLTGAVLPRGHSPASDQVRAWFASYGWCAPAEDAPPLERRPPPPPRPALVERPAPPVDEVRALLRACSPASASPAVSAWLARRLGDVAAARVLERRLVGALPASGPLPEWARYGRRSWRDLGYVAAFALFDAAGAVRSMRVRCVGTPPEKAPKALPPKGFGLAGFVMADAVGRLVLRTGAVPGWWAPRRPFRVVVAEGEPQFLAWAASLQGAGAVLGIVAGSWTDAIAGRVPDGAAVLVCTDHDKAGDRYAARITESLVSRCSVSRWSPPHVPASREACHAG